jgi:hypothetical protein
VIRKAKATRFLRLPADRPSANAFLAARRGRRESMRAHCDSSVPLAGRADRTFGDGADSPLEP